MSDEAIQELLACLKRADATFGQDKRAGCVEALQALHQYLLICPDTTPAHRRPLLALIGALVDSEKGVINPITAAKPSKGGQEKREELAGDQGFAAAVLELFQRVGEDEAYYLSQLSKAVDMNGDALKEYRKLIRKNRAPPASSQMYWTVLHEAKASGQSPIDQARTGLAFLRSKAKG